MPLDVSWQLLLLPLIGAAIGALTNQVAIRMLFRPYAPVRVFGRRLWFTPGVIPSRQFDDRELAYLAAQSPAIACECPMHLAQLISKLVHFEAYSAECESRNDEDRALHAYLHKTTSRARSMMERALTRVVELENLSMPLRD